MSKDSATEAIEAFEGFLHEKRLKMTEQRRQLVQTALDQRGHFSADDLYRVLVAEGEAVSMATVYRGLRLLEESGILEGHDFADGQRRYEPALEREHHDHMICVDCKAVIEFQNERIESLQVEVAEANGFTIHDHTLTLFVECRAWRGEGACERKAEREQRAQRK